MKTTTPLAQLLCVAVLLLGCQAVVQASNFTLTTTDSSAQTLAAGQTGSISTTGTLTYSANSVAITLSGNSTLTNAGFIYQNNVNSNGNGRAIRDNTGVTATITNSVGAVIQSADGDVIQFNKAGGSLTLYNYGLINSINTSAGGAQAIDLNAITTGSNVVYNYATGTISASEADAVRPGVNGFVYNYGTIKSTSSTGSSSDGVDGQTNTGITVVNSGTSAVIEGARHGITGGNTNTLSTGVYAMTISNVLGGTIKGDNGAGVNIDGLNANEVVMLTNSGTITGNGVGTDGDGVDVDGVVYLNNSGTIKSFNSYAATGAAASEGITVGGGVIINSGTIAGLIAATNSNPLAVGRGITLAGIDKDANGGAIPPTPIYINSVVTNSGLIQGQSDSGILVVGTASGFTASINNLAGGVIEGGGSNAVIQTGDEDDTVINSGTIRANGTGKAIYLGGGTNVLQILGGAASVIGDIDGGTGTSSLTIAPGAGNGFSYAGAISNFKSVSITAGTTTLSGVNTYTGATLVNGGTLALSGSIANSSTTLTNSARLHLNGGTAGAVVIGQTTRLTGNGTVGALTVGNGGRLAPTNSAGNGTGTITAGNTTFIAGGTFQLQVNTDGSTGSAGLNFSSLAVIGTLDLTGLDASHQFLVDLQFLDASGALGNLALGFDPNVDHTWANVITTTGGFVGDSFSSDDFSVVSSQPETQVSSGKGTYKFVRNGNNINLQYTAVPEPATWMMMLLGASTCFLATRRRTRQA